jgi:hypothetical protein
VACVEQAFTPGNPSTPRVLLVYYTYTQQTKLVAEAIADVLRDRGCEVRPAAIGFTDKRWAERFSRLPLRHAYRGVFGMLPAQLRAATGEIQIPDRSFLKSDVAERLFDGKRFGAFVVSRRTGAST